MHMTVANACVHRDACGENNSTSNLLARQAEGVSPTNYFEVDFPDVTKKKAAIIANRQPLHRLLEPNLDPQNISKLHPAFTAVMHSTSTGAFCFVAQPLFFLSIVDSKAVRLTLIMLSASPVLIQPCAEFCCC